MYPIIKVNAGKIKYNKCEEEIYTYKQLVSIMPGHALLWEIYHTTRQGNRCLKLIIVDSRTNQMVTFLFIYRADGRAPYVTRDAWTLHMRLSSDLCRKFCSCNSSASCAGFSRKVLCWKCKAEGEKASRQGSSNCNSSCEKSAQFHGELENWQIP